MTVSEATAAFKCSDNMLEKCDVIDPIYDNNNNNRIIKMKFMLKILNYNSQNIFDLLHLTSVNQCDQLIHSSGLPFTILF